jgi:dolichol-phosphate mannosyltransferase
VILPTYNEAENIVDLIENVISNIPEMYEYEILVVDDNSPDNTYHIVKEAYSEDLRIIPILRITDRGFAKSIRDGIENSTGDQIVVMDTDFTHDPVEIPRLLYVGQIYDIVSGSRYAPGGQMQDRFHYFGSFFYNILLRLILHTQVQDNLGGYFTIQKIKLTSLPYDDIFFGYGEYYFRLLHYAQEQGMSIVEVPAKYCTRVKGDSKSNYFKMLIRYTKAMIDLGMKRDK